MRHRRAGLALGAVTVLTVALSITIPAMAHPDAACAALGGVINGSDECEVSGAVSPGAGPFALSHTLRVTSTGSINAPVTGITISTTGSLFMDAGASLIQANDSSGPNAAGPISITTAGDVVMRAGSMVSARNMLAGGAGGNITFDVNGSKMVLCGPAGVIDPACGGATVFAGAIITSDSVGGGNPQPNAGNIVIDVGNFPSAPPTGTFLMETGTQVRANATTNSGAAGDIDITAGFDAQIDGQVLSEQNQGSTGTGATQGRDGASIFISSGCGLRIGETGVVSSQGQDAGADLVHLESCEVTVEGLVQSRGAGHGIPNSPANSCDGEFRDGKDPDPDDPPGPTGCIEIWGRHIEITDTAEVNADINDVGAGGATGYSWIDIFADGHILIDGPTGSTDPFAVHADSYSGSDGSPNTITVKSVNGTVTASGKALSASCSEDLPHTGDPPCNGSDGGALIVEASGTVDLDTATLWAKGDDIGGATQCQSGSGSCGEGGTIDVRSFNADITWQNGVGDVSPDDGTSPPAGDIDLTASTGTTTTGSVFGDAGADIADDDTGGNPTLPGFVLFRTELWAQCQPPPPCPPATTTVTETSTAPGETTTATETATSTTAETATTTVTEVVPGPTVSGTVTETVTSTAPAVTTTATETVTSTAPAVTGTVTETVTSTAPAVTGTVTETVTVTAPGVTETATVTVTVTAPAVSGTATETVTSTAPTVTVTVTTTFPAAQQGDGVAACPSCTPTTTITNPPECTTTTTTVTTPTTGTTVTTNTVTTETTTVTTRTLTTSTHTTGTTTTVTTVTTPTTGTTMTVTTVTTPTTGTTTTLTTVTTPTTGTTTTRTTTTTPRTTTTTTTTLTTTPITGTTTTATTTTTPTVTTTVTRTSVAPTTITSSSTTPVGPTRIETTTPGVGGTVFTGVENVVRIVAIALLLLSAGTGLLWAGARRGRHASR